MESCCHAVILHLRSGSQPWDFSGPEENSVYPVHIPLSAQTSELSNFFINMMLTTRTSNKTNLV